MTGLYFLFKSLQFLPETPAYLSLELFLKSHISRKGAAETRAKCPAAHNTGAARAKSLKQHLLDPVTQPQLTV